MLHSPKRPSASREEWFRYYAGYSDRFVEDLLSEFELQKGATVADPWNGAGTTTTVARRLGLSVYGFDINPVMVIVAKARLAGSVVRPSHISLAERILEDGCDDTSAAPHEPLETWFTPRSALIVRRLERAIRRLLIPQDLPAAISTQASLELVSPLAAFFYTALFRTVRDFLAQYRSTNPTWIKVPEKTGRVRPSGDAICLSFLAHVAAMAPGGILDGAQPQPVDEGSSSIQLADSMSLPLGESTIDAIITSPPYCTRIDYAIATKPELAVLGLSLHDDLSRLRRKMIGTTVVGQDTHKSRDIWGDACCTFLEAVRRHKSRASDSYYFKTYAQYFASIYESLVEFDRVLRPKALCGIVVQDSFYKEIHNDLPRIFVEMTAPLGWSVRRRWDFPIARTMAALNPRHSKYRSRTSAVESVLWFQRH